MGHSGEERRPARCWCRCQGALLSCPAGSHGFRDRSGTQMEPGTEKQGRCCRDTYGRRVGEGPLLGPGGGKRETAVVGTVPEALKTPCPFCGTLPSCRLSECICVPNAGPPALTSDSLGSSLVQGRPHP